ncbi:hypothetical protein Tco_0005408 [Tanacetum coccineum]
MKFIVVVLIGQHGPTVDRSRPQPVTADRRPSHCRVISERSGTNIQPGHSDERWRAYFLGSQGGAADWFSTTVGPNRARTGPVRKFHLRIEIGKCVLRRALDKMDTTSFDDRL